MDAGAGSSFHLGWDCLWPLLPALASACQVQVLWDCALTGEGNAYTGVVFDSWLAFH